MNVPDAFFVGSQCLHKAVDSIARKAEDDVYSPVNQAFDQDIGRSHCMHLKRRTEKAVRPDCPVKFCCFRAGDAGDIRRVSAVVMRENTAAV